MSHARFVLVLAVVAGCADVGPFRASGGADGGVDDAVGATDAPPSDGPPPDGSVEVLPKQLAVVNAVVDGLVVTQGYVYWATESTPYQIQRVAKNGGTVSKIDSGGPASGLDARDTAVAWSSARSIYVTGDASFVAGSPILTVATSLQSIALSPSHLYLSRDQVGSGTDLLERIPRAGGSVEPLSSSFPSPYIAASDTSLYWVSYPGLEPQINRSTFAAPTTIASSVAAPREQRFFHDADRICWTAKPTDAQAIDLWCSPSGTPRRIAIGVYDIIDVASSSAAVYYIKRDYPSTWSIRRYDIATTTTTTVWGPSTTRLPVNLATDATSLYWFDTGATATSGAIVWSLPLP